MSEGSCGTLVIKHEAVLRLLLAAAFGDEGSDVRAAANGREALQTSSEP
jgi:CheY-like chemotaxis protein